MKTVSGWRLALRLAWREAWRAKGRSALVLVMVTFPVVAVVAADVAQATQSVSAVEGLDRQLGSAEAKVTTIAGGPKLVQLPNPSLGSGFVAQSNGVGRGRAPSVGEVVHALGGGPRPTTQLRNAGTTVRTSAGGVAVTEEGADLTDTLTSGLYRLTSGRLATRSGEVDINDALAAYGFHIGDTLPMSHGVSRTIVGTAESTELRDQPLTVGPVGDVPAPSHGEGEMWLVGGAPVTWDDVRSANAVGAVVLSRQVVENPPPLSVLPAHARRELTSDSPHSEIYRVLVLIGVMALIEVILLAGPAFAVGARRQTRNLALLAANGGTPPQSRRTILASAVVLGSVGAVAGAALGIVVGRAVIPFLQGRSDQWFGPFQVRWDHVAIIAVFGLLSALLAAVVPAWIASRQDVVAVLAGRRGDRNPSRRSPVIGLVLLAASVLVAVQGTRMGASDLLIAGSAILAVFGMLFLVPVVVVTVSRLGRQLPLPLRYAVRDAARHRTRTVPAVAAVAATVAGVVALAIGNTSHEAKSKAEYMPQLPVGMSAVTASGHVDWDAIRAAVARTAPQADMATVMGVPQAPYWDIGFLGPALGANYTSTLPTPVLVSDGTDAWLSSLLTQYLPQDEVDRVKAALARDRMVVFGDRPDHSTRVELTIGSGHHARTSRPAATYVDVVGAGNGTAPSQAVVPPGLLGRLGQTSTPAGLLLTGDTLTPQQQTRLTEVVLGIDRNSYVYVERGYQTPRTVQVVLWILFGLAGVLMLGGTLTATFLALSDARPDLATLSAVGAAPRTRRLVAAAYAVSVGVVGAVLGAAVGFIPGVAVTYPLTRTYATTGPTHYLDIPWLLILGLVAVLPVLTALVIGLTARSRLPLVARLD